MPDLTRIDSAEAVEITDGTSLSVKVRTTQPSSGDEALVIREAARGQQTATNSIPVVVASNQSAISVTETRTGQTTMTASMPVVLASDQSTINVTIARGQTTAAQSIPVVLASDQVTNATTTPASTANAIVTREAARGQGLSAASIPVVLASDQSTISVTIARGQTTAAQSIPVVLASDQVTNATTTPASTANAIVTREAARGQQTAANSIPVVLASDQRAADSPQVDAFGNNRVVSPTSVFDSNYVETDNSLYWDSTLTTGGTLTRVANESAMRLTTTTSSGSKVVYRTKQYFPYQQGKSFRICISAVMGALKANVRQRIGYFDDNNGVYWEQDGTNLKVVIRTFTSGSAVSTATNQASWNIDPLNGTGSSGITLDMSKIQGFVIDYAWMGSERIRLGFKINGQIYYCHQFLTSNTGTTVSMTRGSLPISFELENTAGAASGTNLFVYGTSVNSEGGYNPIGICRSVSNGTTTRTVATTNFPLLSIRLKSANNRGTIIPLNISILTTNNTELYWQLILNTTLTGASFSSVSSTAITEFDVAATAISGGETIAAGFANNGIINFNIEPSIRLVSNIAGTADILSIVAVRIGGTSGTCSGQIYYKEVF